MTDVQKLMENIQKIYLRVNKQFKIIIDSDPTVFREDSARGLMSLIMDVKQILQSVDRMSIEERAKHFNITYNAITYISDISSLLRRSNYSFQVLKQLIECILSMEANIILHDVKYLDKRTKIYLDICHIYQENELLEPAIAVLDSAMTKYKQLKAIHQMDPPLPLHVETILSNNLRILKIMNIKYLVQSGGINANDWRKKADEEFADDASLKLLCLVECLRTQTRKQSNIFQKNPHSQLNKNFKEVLVQAGFDIVKPNLQIIQKALGQQKVKIERQVTFKNTQQLTQELINEQIKKKREIEQKNVKMSDFKKASANFPIEYHMQLIHYAFEVKNNKALSVLLEVALLRSECRRIEVPYISDVGIIASSTANPNIPNGYEKINIDLNQANMRTQLKKLRKRNQGAGGEEEKTIVESKDPKDAKKGAKDPKAVPEQSKKVNKDAPTQKELQQINHKFVYVILKRSMSPENAVYDINIVMGDEEEGPAGYMDTRRIVIPYIQESMQVQESKVKQYKGVKESTHMVPYIILKHSKSGLEDEQEKKQAVVDVKPLIARNPIIPPSWGYTKIPVDLRQVPEQFLKNFNHDYVYLTYKNDELFYSCQRHIKILNSLNEVETSFNSQKAQNAADEKLLELGINFSLQKFNNLFLTLQECLDGKLGQDYYVLRCDFLTHLAYHIWIKYLRGPLVQFDYVNEMKLNEQLIDYQYQFYRQALAKCKPVFLNGFKVLNFVMINNQKSDLLLLSRLNLQLLKLLQEEQEYKQAYENAQACLDRIRSYRDQYLTKGLKGNQNKLLPFCLTASNLKVKDTLLKMQQKFQQQRNYIRKLKRIKEQKSGHELNKDQLQQQEIEHLHFQKKDQIDDFIAKVGSSHLQIINILSAVELDIYNIYFRTILKYSGQLKIAQRQSSNNIINGIKESNLQGLASTMKNKLSLMYGKNEQKNSKNLKQLQSTLVQAQKLAPPKPGLHWLEKKTIEQFQKNPYALTLLMANFAAINSQNEDKKYFLQEALENVKKCIEEQEKQCQSAVENAIFIYSSLWDDDMRPSNSSSTVSPFKQLYDGTWQCTGQVPSEPILISKNSTSISIKMPPFKSVDEQKKKKKIVSISLYGKPSANGVDVSTNCNELQGTGLKNRMDEVVKVSNLNPNNLYCFAVAPTNSESELEPIGRTCRDIRTVNPLPIPMLAAVIAKIAYQINEYDLAYMASKIVTDQICEQSYYQTADERPNLIYAYKFKEAALKNMSLLQVRSIVETLYIVALCERKKLKQLKQSKDATKLLVQEKQQRITNWLMLASLLNPCLTSPIVALPFLIPQDFILFKALSLSLIPPKWMNSKLRQLGVKVMEKVLKWGLERNQINLARRITYKWAQRKWLMLGKIIQIEQKKQVKKGAKDSKEQETKMIDKFCRILVQKSTGQMQLFEDSLAVISEEYSDYTSIFIDRAKQQISYYSQFVDNPPEELEAWTNRLSSKLELVEYLKDPLNNIKKIPDSSPLYLQANCKLLRKALELSTAADAKGLLTKSQELSPVNNKEIALSKQIQALILDAIANNIEWIPSAKNDIIRLQEKTGKNLSKQIELYTNYETKYGELTRSVSKMDSLMDKFQDYDYLNIWLSELYFLKATILIINCPSFNVKNPVKGRFDKVRQMNLQDLLKKRKEVEILQKESILYSQADIKALNDILSLLCDAAYTSYCIENWMKLQNIFKLLYNLINRYLITPFHHRESTTWQYFSFIALMGILMLRKIRSEGFDTFKNRYHRKQGRTELKIVATKLALDLEPERMVEIFQPKYYMPELDPNTTKDYWFKKESRIDLEAIGSLVAYAIQALRLQNKYSLVINLARDFCNVTQHYYSLEFLPFMIESQQKLIDEVKESIDKQNLQLNEVVNEFTKKKTSKMKGERQHKLTNEPLPYEIEYEEKRKKILQSMELLTNHRNYLQAQIEASQTVIEEIKRDTSKTVLKQREQRKYMTEFGDDEQHMFKNYGDDTRLAKNRKNAVKDIIDQYDKIYKELKNNKTSKDPLAELQNRNEVGNLQFAIGNYQKAEQFWEDALATIFKTVRPIDNYLQILDGLQSFLAGDNSCKQTLLALNLLFKISKYGSFKKLYYQYNCTQLAARLALSLFESDSKHPQNLLGHANYRLTKLSDQDVLEDEATVNLSELVNSLQYFSLRLIDTGCSIRSLPLVNLYEHIAIDVAKNVEYAVRVKIIKAIALANSGLIYQAMYYLGKIANQKDLPNIWIEPSDQIKRDKGVNWYFEEVFFDNSKPWSDPSNKQAIEYTKKLSLKNEFVLQYGLTSIALFHYARGLLLFKIFTQEIYENFESNQLRIANVQEAENIMRDSLKRLSILEQHYANLEDLEKAKLKLNKNELSDDAQKAVETSKSAVTAYLKNNGIEQALIPRYQSEKPSAFKKVFRVEFMARIRFSIYETHASRRLNSNCFHVLKNALTNVHRFSYVSRKVETGYDPEIGVITQAPAAGKKDDKKAGKKQQEPEPSKEQVNWQLEKQAQIKAEEQSTRISVNIFWHVKISFEIGRLMYQQNRFKTSKLILGKLIEQCKEFSEHYYSIFSQGLVLRCELRLGKFQPAKFVQLIELAHNKRYEKAQYLELVMDYGEIIKGRDCVEMFEKGREVAAHLWEELGMKSKLLGLEAENPQRMFTNKEEITPEQQEEIKRKNKKQEKKGGKDDKKGAKKEDPKKKKDESKAEYKVELLSKYEWWNLLDQEKQDYEDYVLKPHPNYCPNNIYSTQALQYVRCYSRHIEACIDYKFESSLLEQCAYIKKLIKIVQSYPTNGYYYLVHLYNCLAEIYNKVWKSKFQEMLANSKGKKIQVPYGDLPINQELTSLPYYSHFIFENRHLLEDAETNYKKVISLIKGNCLLFDNGFRIDQLLWRAADNQLYLAEYYGRLKPKFYALQNGPDTENQIKLTQINQIGEAINQIDLSIKVCASVNQLYSNYSQLGSKPLEPSAKLDSDIVAQINEIDKQFKSTYEKVISDSLKPKQGINALQLITYIAKIHRESEFMTFSNPSLQAVMLRCHRILLAGCPAYKDKCIVNAVQYTPKKLVDDKLIEVGGICIKSKISGTNQGYLYVLGGHVKEAKPYFGRVVYQSPLVSEICQKLYEIRSKIAISQKKSEAVKNRDFIIYDRELKKLLVLLGNKFQSNISQLPENVKVSLSTENVTTLIKILEESGANCTNKEINSYLRYLHELKYKIKPSG